MYLRSLRAFIYRHRPTVGFLRPRSVENNMLKRKYDDSDSSGEDSDKDSDVDDGSVFLNSKICNTRTRVYKKIKRNYIYIHIYM